MCPLCELRGSGSAGEWGGALGGEGEGSRPVARARPQVHLAVAQRVMPPERERDRERERDEGSAPHAAIV